ncbi:MAG: CinA family protein [Candidatus Pacebacteria bacterium]|nr:CinA family protein [Candidatus Paceibacterota bacterium]
MKTIEEKITALHTHKTKICLVCTGAGAGCQKLIAQVPGASGTLLECFFPYSKEALTDFLGDEPKKFASEETVLAMAAKAWRRGVEIVVRQGGDVRDVMGVAVTGVIATNRPLRGEHRVFIAVRTAKEFFVVHFVFPKGSDGLSLLGRIHEGEISDMLTLNMIFHLIGIEQIIIPAEAIQGEDLKVKGGGIVLNPRKIKQNVEAIDLDPTKHVLFEGSFNPLHFGHERIAKEVELLTAKKVVYVITNYHPDKGGVDGNDLQIRLNQFQNLAPVLATDGLKLYVDKAKAFPGFSFIVGVDTLKRILDQKYYCESVAKILETFEKCQTHFFVADRHDGEEMVNFDVLREKIPVQFQGMFTQIATTVNISSTALRRLK